MKSEVQRFPSIRTITLGVFAVVLMWLVVSLVVSRSFAAYFAEAAPAAALWLRSGEADALVNQADGALNSRPANQTPKRQKNVPDSTANVAKGSAAYSENLNSAFEIVDQSQSVDLSSVRAWAESALMHEPLNARALRILGQAAAAAKDDAGAWKFMQAAARLSLHENVAGYWLMQKSAEVRDYKAVIYYADVLLRAAPQFGNYVVPVLAQAAEEGTSESALKSVLAGNPPWRQEFFSILPGVVSDARIPLDLLNSLRTTSTPPTSADIDPYLQFLIGRKLYDLAYYTWLQFLPPEELRNAGLLFNGNFEFAPSGLPFDWVIKPGSGVTVDIVPRPDGHGEHALLVNFDYGRVDYHSIRQLVLLMPGTYQFVAKYKGELAGPRGLRWRILCAGNPTAPVGESAIIGGIVSAWRDVGFSFTVPAADCRAQYVQLDLDARMASEQLVSGSMLFDELHISRSMSLRPSGTRGD
jgi:hypothetical protein